MPISLQKVKIEELVETPELTVRPQVNYKKANGEAGKNAFGYIKYRNFRLFFTSCKKPTELQKFNRFFNS